MERSIPGQKKKKCWGKPGDQWRNSNGIIHYESTPSSPSLTLNPWLLWPFQKNGGPFGFQNSCMFYLFDNLKSAWDVICKPVPIFAAAILARKRKMDMTKMYASLWKGYSGGSAVNLGACCQPLQKSMGHEELWWISIANAGLQVNAIARN